MGHVNYFLRPQACRLKGSLPMIIAGSPAAIVAMVLPKVPKNPRKLDLTELIENGRDVKNPII